MTDKVQKIPELCSKVTHNVFSILFFFQYFEFLTISYFVSIPTNYSDLEFHCIFEVLHLKKLEKIIFEI